jgi:hypothetical protein
MFGNCAKRAKPIGRFNINTHCLAGRDDAGYQAVCMRYAEIKRLGASGVSDEGTPVAVYAEAPGTGIHRGRAARKRGANETMRKEVLPSVLSEDEAFRSLPFRWAEHRHACGADLRSIDLFEQTEIDVDCAIYHLRPASPHFIGIATAMSPDTVTEAEENKRDINCDKAARCILSRKVGI